MNIRSAVIAAYRAKQSEKKETYKSKVYTEKTAAEVDDAPDSIVAALLG